ncbi:MAG: serine hydrolase [Hungatella sp.]
MKKWNIVTSLCLAASLLFSIPAQAEILIPPISSAGGAQTGDQGGTANDPSLQGPSAPGTSVTESQPDQEKGPGVGLDPTQTQNPAQTQNGSAAAAVEKPQIASEGAVLLDVSTGTFLYEKNGDTRFYPASITKLMTALLVAERCQLTDTVTFSETATTNLESGAVSLGLTAGDQLTVEQCLYALLLKSANEVGNGLAEHVAGSVSAFAQLMNEKARSLGCTNTNFTNPHGLNDSSHYTTPRDMALIAKAAMKNDIVRKVAGTVSYQFPATKKSEARTITMGHKMLYPTDSRYYEGIIGGKTGYTSLAGNTLVTAAEKDGVRMIAVVMKSKSTHYDDTRKLLDYGFAVKKAGSNTSVGTADTGWKQDSTGWYYVKQDQSYAANEWMTIDGEEYWFDSNGYMATGWRQYSNDAWYYFRSSGAMAKNYWAQSNDKWFYLGADGSMLKNTTTPDGYPVGADGAWIVS